VWLKALKLSDNVVACTKRIPIKRIPERARIPEVKRIPEVRKEYLR